MAFDLIYWTISYDRLILSDMFYFGEKIEKTDWGNTARAATAGLRYRVCPRVEFKCQWSL